MLEILVPAIVYKDEIEEAFAKELYSDKYFYYMGWGNCGTIPEIKVEDCYYYYAIINKKEKLIGFLSYYIDTSSDCISNFGLYSFDKGNPIIGKDLFEKLNELIKYHHRIEWRMISGNPVKKHYDKFCKQYDGNIVHLHDVTKDVNGNYHDEYIYEIINKEI